MGSITLIFAASLAAAPGWGALPAPDEQAAAHAWVEKAFLAQRGAPPFSFVYGGRSSRELLGTWSVARNTTPLDSSRTQLLVTYANAEAGLEVRCRVIEYADFPAVEWVLNFTNTGTQDSALLEHVEPLDWAIPGVKQGAVLHSALGDSNSAESFAPVDQALSPASRDALVFAPKGGRSSDGHMPFFSLEWERQGAAVAVGWSGQWEARFQYVSDDALQVQAGMQTCRLKLHPGETIRSPRILVVFWKGEDAFRGNNLFRQVMLAHYSPRRNGELVLPPICASVGEVDPDGSYEGPHVRIMPIHARRGIEVFWSDMDPQQWYPGGFPDGTGTWEPDPVKYPHGMKPIGEAAHAAGLQYLLWFEPERAARGSRIAREHPEWVTGGAAGGLFRLDLPEARRWLTDYIDVQIMAAKLDWVRWDFNIEPLKYWQKNDEPDRQGIAEIRHIEGLYAMWDDLCARHPGLVIDVCASGGRRIDIETCSRGLHLWHSDLQCFGPKPAAEQLQNAALFRWIPLHGCGNFGYEPSYAFRSAMTAGNILVGADVKDPAESDNQVKRSVAAYKKIRPFMLGDFYPLFPHNAVEGAWFGYQFHRADLNAGCAILFRREKAAETSRVALKGIDPNSSYEVEFEDASGRQTHPGAELGALPVTVPSEPGAVILYYRKS